MAEAPRGEVIAASRSEAATSSAPTVRHTDAPPAAVHSALVTAESIARWKFPDGVARTVHAFADNETGLRMALDRLATLFARAFSSHAPLPPASRRRYTFATATYEMQLLPVR